MSLKPRERFADRYLHKLTRGAGNTGVVYQVEDLRLQRLVALKTMHEELVQNALFQKQFEQEAHLLAKLSHPSIIALYDFNSQPEPHLVMPYYEDNLRDYLLKNGHSIYEIVDIGIQIGQALSYLYTTTKKIHGDIKPENILLKPLTKGQYLAVLTDFGLSQLQDAEKGGTPTYMSPEQCLQQQTDGRSDIYSLGVVLYELLAKHPPFVAETPEAARRHHHARTPFPSLARSRPDLSNELVEVIMTMLAPNPEDRYGDALTAVNALRAAQPSPTNITNDPLQPPAPVANTPLQTPEQSPTGTHLSISQQFPRQIQLDKTQARLIIGSNPKELGTHIVLRGAEVAPRHAELYYQGDRWFISPLDKEKPIYLNGEPIYTEAPWEAYKTLQIGTHFLRLNLAEETVESSRSFDVALTPSQLEGKLGGKQKVEVIIHNGSKQRGYYQIKVVPPPDTAVKESIVPAEWLMIRHNGIPVVANDRAMLPLELSVPANATPGNYCFAIEGEALATNDSAVTAVGYLVISQETDFAVAVSSTDLLENQVCWVSITNAANSPHSFALTLSDMEQELLFGLVPEEKTPTLPPTNGRSASPPTVDNFSPPAAQSISGIRSLPFLRSFFDPLRQNWVSRLWRRITSQVRYVRGLRRYLPDAPRLIAERDEGVAILPAAFFHPPKLYTKLEKLVTIPPQQTARVGFAVEAKERPFTARHPQNHAFTLNVHATADIERTRDNRRAATVTIQPRHRFGTVAIFTGLLIALPLLLVLLLWLGNSDLRQRRAAAAALAAENPDGGENSGAEVLLRTDPTQPPATPTFTPMPFTIPIPIALATSAPSPTATLPTQLFSQGSDDGYLIMSGKQITIVSDDPVLRVGDTAANGAIRTIVSFDTSAITSDTPIRTVELFFWPAAPPDDGEAIDVANVLQQLGNYLYADMAPGGFGNGRGLGPDDFSAQTDAVGLQIAQLQTAPNGVQVRLLFNKNQEAVIAALQQYDTVEFRLYFLLPSNENDTEEQYMLVSGEEENGDKRPYLEITYGR